MIGRWTRSDGGNVSRDMSFVLAGLTALALALYLIGVTGWIRGMIAIVVYTFVPGAAVLSLLPRMRLIARVALAACFSLTIIAVISYALVLTRLFYPAIVVALVFPLSVLVLLLRTPAASPREQRRSVASRMRKGWDHLLGDRLGIVLSMVLLVAAGLWLIGVSGVDYTKMGDYGLVSLLPLSWKASFALIIGAIGVYATSQSPRPWLMATLVGALAAAIYLVPVWIYDVPHYPWNYKHVGVTELLLHHHRKFSFVDIYNRWPAMFAASGVYTRFGGFSTPLSFIGWAEFYFIGLQSMLVAAIAFTEDRRLGVAGLTATLFILINWIGQAYFSPQAYAFTLMLAIVLIAFGQLYDGGNRYGGWLRAIGEWLVRTKQRWPGRPERTEWSTAQAIAALLAIDLAVAMVHQLTPYVLLIQLVMITVTGYLRPRWLVIAAGAITVAYLAPQFGWINENFGVLSSLDPGKNIGRDRVIEMACNSACLQVNVTIMAFTAGAALLATGAVLFLGRRRPTTRIPLLALSFIAPFMTLLGQNYGGEAILRVVMFSAPFSALLIALALSELRGRIMRPVATLGLLFAFGAAFVISFFGQEQDRYLTPTGVRAAQYVYAHAPYGSELIPLAPNVPGQLSYNYWTVYSPFEGLYVCKKLRDREFTPQMVDDLANWVGAHSPNVYIIYGPELEEYVEEYGLMPKGTPEKLRQAMLKSPLWQLWHQDGTVQVFKLNEKVWEKTARPDPQCKTGLPADEPGTG